MILSFVELYKRVLDADYTKIGDEVDYCFQEEGSTLYILFEESSSKIDWRHNFAFLSRPYKDMATPYRVHGGFLKCWKTVEDIVIAKIKETKEDGSYKYDSIICAGWSHGGALTMFCHECVWYHRPDIRQRCMSVSYDGPRVYWGFKVKKELRERWTHFYEIINDSDIVTHVPPRLFGFTHTGNVLHIGRHARYGCIDSHRDTSILASLKEIEMGGIVNE